MVAFLYYYTSAVTGSSIYFIVHITWEIYIFSEVSKHQISQHCFFLSENVPTLLMLLVFNNNNNNIAFQSQASWGRLELKPTKSPKSRFRHFNSCFPSTPIQTQISRYIPSFQISFYCLPPCQFRSSSTSPHIISLAQDEGGTK